MRFKIFNIFHHLCRTLAVRIYIIFKSLSRDIVYNILDKIISDIEIRLKDKNIKISLTNSAKDKVINEAYDISFGARPIKRYVGRNLIQKLLLML